MSVGHNNKKEQCGKASHFESESDFFSGYTCTGMTYQLIIIITDDVMIMIVNNVDSTKLEYLNSIVTQVTYMHETIDTRCDTVWILKLSLIPTKPSK